MELILVSPKKGNILQSFVSSNNSQDHKSLRFYWIQLDLTCFQMSKINPLYFGVVVVERLEVTRTSRLKRETQNIHENCPQTPINTQRWSQAAAASPDLCPAVGYLVFHISRVWIKRVRGKLGKNCEESCKVWQEILPNLPWATSKAAWPSRSREVNLPLHSSLVRPHLDLFVSRSGVPRTGKAWACSSGTRGGQRLSQGRNTSPMMAD